MSFITVAGIDLLIQEGGAKVGKPEKVGKSVRSFAGNLRSTQSAAKRLWSFTTAPMTAAAIATLHTAAPDGSFVVCTGVALDSANVTCEINYESEGFLIDQISFTREVTFTLREV